MCGIVAYTGHRDAWPILLDGLKKLEYRGYDSAGIAIFNPSGDLETFKSDGKVRELDNPGAPSPKGTLGIGHTRWATHGRPSVANAHPHTGCRHQVAVVHNGIIENYLELKQRLLADGHSFSSETDSEVVAHLIECGMESGLSFEDAFIAMASQVQGSQAIVSIGPPDSASRLLALRLGYAGGIVLGHREGEAIISSDLQPLAPLIREVSFLEDGEVAVVTNDGIHYVNLQGEPVSKETRSIPSSVAQGDKEGYPHHMLKEIMEQPLAAVNCLRGRVNFENSQVELEQFPLSPQETRDLRKVVLVGMGTSLHAAMVGRHFIESLAKVPAEVDNASEFRYRDYPMDQGTLVLGVSQSGETADTLAAMSEVRQKGGRLLSICNTEMSQANRLAEGTLLMRSGLEVGVASTKTFTSSLGVLLLLALHLGQARGTLAPTYAEGLLAELSHIPHLMGRLLSNVEGYKSLAETLGRYQNLLYLGRGINLPIALEGALKLKEIAYVHAEGYAAGEMKHGPVALIDADMPVVAVAPDSSTYPKIAANIKEVKARDGVVIGVLSEGDSELASEVEYVLWVPRTSETLSPFLTSLAMQMLAYEIAVQRGCEVDQPRNLAKSVTVE